MTTPHYAADGSTRGDPVRINYREAGTGVPLLLLHGTPGSASNFKRIMPILAEQFRVIAVDLPGFGASSRRVADYGIKAHARYVLDVMGQLAIDRAHVFGFSMGSGVALHMAELAPDRVASITVYGGIGIQEGEGSGDYHFEHFKYAVGYACLIVAPELVPHFGLLGPRSSRHAFIRNFWDSDQRPLRLVLEYLDEKTPMLILHGLRDPLVWASVAREHHRIVNHSDLVLFDGGHFMLFGPRGASALADEVIQFINHHRDPVAQPRRRVVDPGRERSPSSRGTALPVDLRLERTMNPWWKMLLIIFGTFVSEDITCISVGLLVNRYQLDVFLGLLGCFLGIFLGDIGLWLLGRFVGRRLLGWNWLAKRLPERRLDLLRTWLDRHSWWAVFASRFMPGTRFPLYVSAGMFGVQAWRFISWAFISDTIWTPLIVLIVAWGGDAAVRPFELLFGPGWVSIAAAVVMVFLMVRVVVLATSPRGRARLWVKLSRIWRWEFWPMWLFYAPIGVICCIWPFATAA